MDSLRTVLAFLKPYRRAGLLALAATLAFTGLSLMPPLLLRFLVDRIIKPGAWELLLWAVLAIAATPVLLAAVRFANVWTIMYIARRVIADLRLGILRNILSLHMGYHTTHSRGATVAKMMDDVNRLQRLFAADTVRIVVDVMVFFFSVGFVFWLSPYLGGVLMVFIGLYVVAYRIFSRRIRTATQEFREVYDTIAGRLNETVAGVRQVRIYNREDRETELFLHHTAESLKQELASRMHSVTLGTVCSTIAGIGSTIIVATAAILVIHGRISEGDLLAINTYIWMAIHPALRLTQVFGELAETKVSVDRIAEVLEQRPQIVSKPDAPVLPRSAGAVTYDDVHFRYEADTPLFEGLNLDVEPGMTVALVGPTGCGKTTLTALLLREWDVTGGAVRVDGRDVREVQLPSLRKLFGVVLQRPVLFEGTLAENIAYGRPDATREQVIEAARAAEIYHTASELPGGLDTIIGTRGVQLSVGERQRVSIARAILRDPLILIMDEATSSLDSRSEALIQKALGRVLKGRTSFIIAHRLSTITTADRIVVMDDGAIVESGSHEELLTRDGGLYRRLYEEMTREGGEA